MVLVSGWGLTVNSFHVPQPFLSVYESMKMCVHEVPGEVWRRIKRQKTFIKWKYINCKVRLKVVFIMATPLVIKKVAKSSTIVRVWIDDTSRRSWLLKSTRYRMSIERRKRESNFWSGDLGDVPTIVLSKCIVDWNYSS